MRAQTSPPWLASVFASPHQTHELNVLDMVVSFNENAEETDFPPICPPLPGDKSTAPSEGWNGQVCAGTECGHFVRQCNSWTMPHGSPSTYGKSTSISLPSFPGPTSTKDLLLRVKGCSFKSATTLSQQQVLKVLFPAHTCTHTLAITVDYRWPLSCPEYYYTDAKKTPNLSLNTEIKKQQYRKK